MRYSPEALTALAERVLATAGANAGTVRATARVLVAADERGLTSHGVARLMQYAAHLRNGRADG